MERNRMPSSNLGRALQRATALLLALMMVPAAWSQQNQTAPNAPSAAAKMTSSSSQPFDLNQYSKPRSQFPNFLAPYMSREVAPPKLANTPRIDQLMRDGKIYLSMADAVALALENNLDIAISRYNLNIADTDIWRAKAGSATLGVNTGVVQNTPGGTGVSVGTTSTGGGAGGTSTGIGGAGTGFGGLVSSTIGVGAPVPSFDPTITGTLQMDRNTSQNTSAFGGVPFSITHTDTANFSYQQGFSTGTNLIVGFNNGH